MRTTTSVPTQDFRASRTLPDHLNLPPTFDAKRWPILARHWFGIVSSFGAVTQNDDAGVKAEAA